MDYGRLSCNFTESFDVHKKETSGIGVILVPDAIGVTGMFLTTADFCLILQFFSKVHRRVTYLHRTNYPIYNKKQDYIVNIYSVHISLF